MKTSDSRLLVIGAGSIGLRHAHNFARLGASVHVADPNVGRLGVVTSDRSLVAVERPEASAYDRIVIASPSSLHAEHLAWALQSDAIVLVEKPLAMRVDELSPHVLAEMGRVLVGFNLRFHDGYGLVRRALRDGSIGQVCHAHFWFGSHLPDWRSTDYRDSYSARADLGGGVLRDAAHELDLAQWLLGDPAGVHSGWIGRRGVLEIDVEDTVLMLATFGDVPTTVRLDYLSRRYRRGVELVGTDGTLVYDWGEQQLRLETRDECVRTIVPSDASSTYEREAQNFLRWTPGTKTEAATGDDAIRIMRLTDQFIEQALR